MLFAMPFTNDNLEKMFSRMLRVKSDWHNQLTRDHLHSLLETDEEGKSLKMFNPEPGIFGSVIKYDN